MKEKVTASRSTRLVQLKCHLIKCIMRQWCNNRISSAALHLARPSAVPCHLRNEFAHKDYIVPLKHWKMPCTSSVEHVAFCLLLNTAAFPCKDVHHLYISMCVCCVGECSFSGFLSLSAPLPLFSFILFFLSLKGFLLPLSHTACELTIFRFAGGTTKLPLFKATF